MFAGGGRNPGEATQYVFTFDPATETWERQDDIPGDPQAEALRWYPTLTTMTSGDVLLTAGRMSQCDDTPNAWDYPLIFHPDQPIGQSTQWSSFAGEPQAQKVLHWYPFVFQAGSGKLFMGGGYYFSTAGDRDPKIHFDTFDFNSQIGTWTVVDRAAEPGGSAVMYRPDKIMKAGSGQWLPIADCCNPMLCPQNGVANAYTIDLNGSRLWTSIEDMTHARRNFYLIVLPDGRVMAVGGFDENADAVYTPEWYDPDGTALWDELAQHDNTQPRTYHSAAVLLPSGKVVIGGGELGGAEYVSMQIFQPPYLFGADGTPANLPVISSAPGTISYGVPFDVQTPDAALITKVSLIRLGAATHSFDQNQRFVPLEFTNSTPGAITVSSPTSGNVAPPGYYMLFILKDAEDFAIRGIRYPSEAAMVRLN